MVSKMKQRTSNTDTEGKIRRLQHVVNRLEQMHITTPEEIASRMGLGLPAYQRYFTQAQSHPDFIDRALTGLLQIGIDKYCIEFVETGLYGVRGHDAECTAFDFEMLSDVNKNLIKTMSDVLFEQIEQSQPIKTDSV